MGADALGTQLGTACAAYVGVAFWLAQPADAAGGIRHEAYIGDINIDVGEKHIDEDAARYQPHEVEERYFRFGLVKKVVEHRHTHQQCQGNAHDEKAENKGHIKGVERGGHNSSVPTSRARSAGCCYR